MGLGVLPTHADNSLGMLGMHGTYYANYAVDQVRDPTGLLSVDQVSDPSGLLCIYRGWIV